MNFIKIVSMFVLSLIGCSKMQEEPKVISQIPYSDGYCSLREDGMVLIECSGGKDMLPITLVSQELVDAFVKDLESKSQHDAKQ